MNTEMIQMQEALDAWAKIYERMNPADAFHKLLLFSEAEALANLLAATGRTDLAHLLIEDWAAECTEEADECYRELSEWFLANPTTPNQQPETEHNMTNYADHAARVDYAARTGATSVTVDIEEGELDLTPAEAATVYRDLAPGEGFTVTGITWGAPAVAENADVYLAPGDAFAVITSDWTGPTPPLQFSGTDPTASERVALESAHARYTAAVRGGLVDDERAASCALIAELMNYSGISEA